MVAPEWSEKWIAPLYLYLIRTHLATVNYRFLSGTKHVLTNAYVIICTVFIDQKVMMK